MLDEPPVRVAVLGAGDDLVEPGTDPAGGAPPLVVGEGAGSERVSEDGLDLPRCRLALGVVGFDHLGAPAEQVGVMQNSS